jgi:hypothetical protein
MAKWSHVQTYQGYPCQSVRFRRSPGLEADHGEVVVSYEDLQKISIEIRTIPWDSVSSTVVPSPASIHGTTKVARPTVTAPSQAAASAGGGLKAYGALVLESRLDGALLGRQLRYEGIYVEDGVEEMDTRLAGAREHNVGRVRVPLTDIRTFWGYGVFLERINCRLRTTGNWDKQTTKPGGSPFSAQDVFRHLFSQLPGSPAISGGDLFDGNYEPPDNLVGDGDPVKQVIRRLLDRYGLECYLQPDNSIIVSKRANEKVTYGSFWEDPKQPRGVEHVSEEKKTVWVTKRPGAVIVVGRRKVRRIAMGFVPCIQDPEDGKFYQLEPQVKKWGYSMDKVNKEILSGNEKSFRDVGPKDTRKGYLRAKALREWAYRGYAPAHAFTGVDGAYDPENTDPLYGLPMVDAAWTKDEAKRLGGGKLPRGGVGKGAEDFILLGPVVYGARYGQGFFADFDEIKKDFKAMQASYKERMTFTEDLITTMRGELSDQVDIAAKAQESLGRLATGEAKGKFGNANLRVAAGQDLSLSAKDFIGQSNAEAVFQASYSNLTAQARSKQLKAGIAAMQETLKTERKASEKWAKKLEDFKKIYEKLGGIQVWRTLPHGPIPQGAFSLDPQTGILRFAEPACVVEEPYLLQREGAKVAGSGSVSVIWGYEVNDGLPSDWTTVLISADGAGGSEAGGGGTTSSNGKSPTAAVCAIGRGSPIAPQGEKDPNLVLYENEKGEPHNVTAVGSAAYSRGAGALEVPPAVTGWEYVMQGHRRAVLESGVSQIQHEFDGVKARTYVGIHSPGGRGPLGPVKIIASTSTAAVAASEGAIKAGEGR